MLIFWRVGGGSKDALFLQYPKKLTGKYDSPRLTSQRFFLFGLSKSDRRKV